ncbi:chemotaxis protein CheB [Actinoplanes sp. CA-054009]
MRSPERGFVRLESTDTAVFEAVRSNISPAQAVTQAAGLRQTVWVPGSALPAAARAEVVALVSSAGGLDALSTVLRTLPEDFPAAIVVALHLGGQGSRLVEILARRIALPVAWARQGAPLAAGAVTVCPARSRLEILPDRTCSIAATGSRYEDRPLDALLVSLGDSVGVGAVATVLTGMGNDGARGAATVREAGGLVIVQSEDTAQEPSMPRAAIESGAADLILPVYGGRGRPCVGGGRARSCPASAAS